MIGQHTPGKMVANGTEVWSEDECESCHPIVGYDYDNRSCRLPEELEANARRIAACWNAFDGYSTNAIENLQSLKQFIRDKDKKLTEARALLKEIVGDGTPFMGAIELCAIDGCSWHERAKSYLDACNTLGE